MQLYEVWFQVHYANVVDIGRALVCAQDQANAKEIVIGQFDLPASMLKHCDAKRIKPNVFLLERKDVTKPAETPALPEDDFDGLPVHKGLRAAANTLAENREYRREMSQYIAQQRWAMDAFGVADETEFECRILACVVATDEDTVMRRLASALKARSLGITDGNRHVTKLLVDLLPDYERG